MKCTAVCVSLLTLGLLSLFRGEAVAQSLSLIPLGSAWKYLDDGTDPSTGWRAALFDDAAWPSGPAQLGFGDGDEATVLDRVNSLGTTNITFYFRHAFNVADVSAVSNLLVRLRRDDGAVVYLNGTEVFRSNLPTGPIQHRTLALAAASDDGTNFVANSVTPALLLPGQNVLAVEIHQSAETSSDISFDLQLVSNVQFQPPSVAITRPSDGEAIGSLNLDIEADADDTDGSVVMVEFFSGNTMLGTDTVPPFSLTWSNAPVGAFTLRAVAFDSTGLTATSAPVNVTVPVRLIPSGSEWRYRDIGGLTDSSWTTPGFDDAAWPAGTAQLGFGDGDESTVLSRTNLVGNTNVTYYFRHAFNVANPASLSSLVVRILRDDGCIAYLNGIEIFRDNMPSGTVTSETFATDAIDDRRFRAARVNPALLSAGPNLLAVEVHQAALTSSDVSFDLELRPNIPPTPPSIAISSPAAGTRFLAPADVTIDTSTDDLDDRVASVTFLVNGSPAGTDNSEPFSLFLSAMPAGVYSVAAVATDEFGNTTTSQPVAFSVVSPAIVTSLIPTGSVWKYFDGGADLGTTWLTTAFDDATWRSGAGKLGSNDNPVTTIDIGPVGNRYITTYFRRQFQCPNPGSVTNLAFRVLRDDGCVVYLNGIELFRMNLAAGPMSFTNRAIVAVGGTNEYYYYPASVEPPPGILVQGNNVIAVELHQTDTTSSDAGFDLGLDAVSPPVLPPTSLSISVLDSETRITWPGSGFLLQSAPAVDGPYSDLAPVVTISPYVVSPPGSNRFFRLRQGP